MDFFPAHSFKTLLNNLRVSNNKVYEPPYNSWVNHDSEHYNGMGVQTYNQLIECHEPQPANQGQRYFTV